MARPNVQNIQAGAPFLETFVRALLNGEVVASYSRALDPLRFSNATIYVPTRRAAKALASELARQMDRPSVLLPRILPLGGLDLTETELLFSHGADDNPLLGDLPQAAGTIQRRMILTRLILEWAKSLSHAIVRIDATGGLDLQDNENLLVASTPQDAWYLSGQLAALIDEILIEDIDWKNLSDLGAEHDDYWRITTHFLDIAIRMWPGILAEQNLVDPVRRQIALISAQAVRIAGGTLVGPVIAIGSTGTNVTTAALLKAIAHAPQGAVVLPGLDRTLDDETFALLGPEVSGHDAVHTHPQSALARLLVRLGVTRDDVVDLGALEAGRTARMRFLHEALRPADSTEKWQEVVATTPQAELRDALRDITLIQARDEREEALAIALALREMIEEPNTTAALITPDRTLARRVRSELLRWSIAVDDSGGNPLSECPQGVLARLAVDCVARQSSPSSVMALLNHPLLALGHARTSLAEIARAIEIGVLRAVLPDDLFANVSDLMADARKQGQDVHAHPFVKQMPDDQWSACEQVLCALRDAVQGLRSLSLAPLPAWIAAHQDCLIHLTATQSGDASRIGTDGEALAALFDELTASADPALMMNASDYAGFFTQLAREVIVRGPALAHPRLKILGLLEARLIESDVVVLGGLDEGVWPPQPSSDVFLNRPMRSELKLSPPERRIGQTAHDFIQACGAARVIITHAMKRGSSPTVPSRFLQRMGALAGDAMQDALERGSRLLTLARLIDRPDASLSLSPPMPRPPVALRPTRLSVTRIETLRRDPYSIYAEKILKLIPLTALGDETSARDIGNDFHKLLDDFTQIYPSGTLPDDAFETLTHMALQQFEAYADDADFKTFRWPRIHAAIQHHIVFENERRADLSHIFSEAEGRYVFPLADGSSFTLSGTADRIELRTDGSLALVDYKTGHIPSLKQVRAGFSPQLTLEAAMAEHGAFKNIPAGRVHEALYRSIGKGEDDKTQLLKWGNKNDPVTLDEVVAKHTKGLVTLLSLFRLETQAYVARPFPHFTRDYNDYEHLSRVKEWSAGNGESE